LNANWLAPSWLHQTAAAFFGDEVDEGGEGFGATKFARFRISTPLPVA
jgi:hypothetical protein